MLETLSFSLLWLAQLGTSFSANVVTPPAAKTGPTVQEKRRARSSRRRQEAAVTAMTVVGERTAGGETRRGRGTGGDGRGG